MLGIDILIKVLIRLSLLNNSIQVIDISPVNAEPLPRNSSEYVTDISPSVINLMHLPRNSSEYVTDNSSEYIRDISPSVVSLTPFPGNSSEYVTDNSSDYVTDISPSAVNLMLLPRNSSEEVADIPLDEVNAEHRPSDCSDTDICFEPMCLKSAADILFNLDNSVEPCDDFYQFACGGWIKRHVISDGSSSISTFSKFQDDFNIQLRLLLEKELTGEEPDFIHMVKEMYDSCMDLESIEKESRKPLEKVLKSLGGWPVVEGKKWNPEAFDWLDTLGRIRKMGFNHNILLSVNFKKDNSSTPLEPILSITVDPASLGMPYEMYWTRKYREDYSSLMIKAANMLGANESTSGQELEKAFTFEMVLAGRAVQKEELHSFSMDYGSFKSNPIAQIDWDVYFKKLLNIDVADNTVVYVEKPSYINNLGRSINLTDKRELANYMLWRVVQESFPLLSEEWRALADEHQLLITGEKRKPRSEQCISEIVENMGVALSSYYARQYFRTENQFDVYSIVEYFRTGFINILENSDWMNNNKTHIYDSNYSKSKAHEKVRNTKLYLAYPYELLNDSYVSDIYTNLNLRNRSYFNKTMQVRKWAFDNVFSQLTNVFENEKWKRFASVLSRNITYHNMEKIFEVPVRMLRYPFFDKDRPHYLNFGAIGSVIGSEFTHGFDVTGGINDRGENDEGWWTDHIDNEFTKTAKCFIDQYNNYTTEIGMQVNGTKTLLKNIADHGGLKAAYKAYQSWLKENRKTGKEQNLPGLNYTQDQLFFISAANVWCEKVTLAYLQKRIRSESVSPNKFRVIGAMSNLPQFSQAFGCSENSAMNRRSKCGVW